jgi:hypothetical protein
MFCMYAGAMEFPNPGVDFKHLHPLTRFVPRQKRPGSINRKPNQYMDLEEKTGREILEKMVVSQSQEIRPEEVQVKSLTLPRIPPPDELFGNLNKNGVVKCKAW